MRPTAFASCASHGAYLPAVAIDYAAEPGVACDVGLLDTRQINQAYERVERGAVNCRFVIDQQQEQKSRPAFT